MRKIREFGMVKTAKILSKYGNKIVDITAGWLRDKHSWRCYAQLVPLKMQDWKQTDIGIWSY